MCMSVVLVGCGKAQDNSDKPTVDEVTTGTENGEVETTTEEEYPPNPDPEPLGAASFTGKSEMPGLGNEVMYDNIKVEMEETTYKLGEEKIKCNIINQNVGKGFWIYHIPLL